MGLFLYFVFHFKSINSLTFCWFACREGYRLVIHGMVKVVSLLYLHPDIRHLQFCGLHIIYVLLRKAEKKVSSYETFFEKCYRDCLKWSAERWRQWILSPLSVKVQNMYRKTLVVCIGRHKFSGQSTQFCNSCISVGSIHSPAMSLVKLCLDNTGFEQSYFFMA